MTEAKKEALGLRLWRLFLRALPLIGLTALGLWLWLSGEKPSVDVIKEAVRTYTDDKPLMVALFLLLLFALKSVSLMFPILVLMAACGALFMVLLLVFRTPILRLLGADEQTLPHASAYYRWIAVGAPFIIVSLTPSNQRVANDTGWSAIIIKIEWF